MPTRYSNGYIPASALTKIDSGLDRYGYYEHVGSPHIIWLWRQTQAYALRKWGKKPLIRSGWNIYRPYDVQKAARDRACAAGNCAAAAYPGTSSHGGTWISVKYTGNRRVDALAIDVDENGLSWAQVWEAARAAGFLCGAITTAVAGIEEPWHIIDLDPWGAVPAGGEDVDVPLTQQEITAIATEVWKLRLQAKDATGADIPNVTYTAQGMLSNINGLVTGVAQAPAPPVAPTADEIWKYRIPALDASGKPIVGTSWSAQGALANASAKADFAYANPVSITQAQIDVLAAAIVAEIEKAGIPVDTKAIVDGVLAGIKTLTFVAE